MVAQFPKGHPVDMHLFLTEQPEWRAAALAEQPIWVASDVPLAEPGVTRSFDYIYRPSEVRWGGVGAERWDAACRLLVPTWCAVWILQYPQQRRALQMVACGLQNPTGGLTTACLLHSPLPGAGGAKQRQRIRPPGVHPHRRIPQPHRCASLAPALLWAKLVGVTRRSFISQWEVADLAASLSPAPPMLASLPACPPACLPACRRLL